MISIKVIVLGAALVMYLYSWHNSLLMSELLNIRHAIRAMYALIEFQFSKMHEHLDTMRAETAAVYTLLMEAARDEHGLLRNNSAKLDEIGANVELLLSLNGGNRWA